MPVVTTIRISMHRRRPRRGMPRHRRRRLERPTRRPARAVVGPRVVQRPTRPPTPRPASSETPLRLRPPPSPNHALSLGIRRVPRPARSRWPLPPSSIRPRSVLVWTARIDTIAPSTGRPIRPPAARNVPSRALIVRLVIGPSGRTAPTAVGVRATVDVIATSVATADRAATVPTVATVPRSADRRHRRIDPTADRIVAETAATGTARIVVVMHPSVATDAADAIGSVAEGPAGTAVLRRVPRAPSSVRRPCRPRRRW